ncbi:MAG: IS91 family transposase, partial [Gammaproteobacteria bacterium]|nr:IS91 family transposase [Gammaproteobacteria bacterium]
MIHHPHIHGIIPGGGLSADGQQWIACKTGFFLPVRVLSRLFRRLFLELLLKSYQKDQLHFYHKLKSIEEKQAFSHWLKPLRQKEWIVYAKRPFAGPKAVLAYLSQYTHRVAIANSRLISMDDKSVTFKWKDYRKKEGYQQKHMTLSTNEFIQRFLLHILPKQFHRI